MIRMMFMRTPIGEPLDPSANFQPELIGEVDGEQVALSVYGEKDFGLRTMFDGKATRFEGQQTYNALRKAYLGATGSVFARVDLQRIPSLSLEQTVDGWCVLKAGGAEYPHFDGLIGRLEAEGFAAQSVRGRAGFDAVAIQITEGEELAAFTRLVPIIKGSA